MRTILLTFTTTLLLTSSALAQNGRRLGAYFGVDLGVDPHPGDPHVGFVYAAPAFGIVELYPALQVFFDRMGDGSVWQASLALRARSAQNSPLYAGAGLNVRSDTFDPGLLLGVEMPWTAARPFFEFRFFGTDIDRASYAVIVGTTFPLP